MTIFDLHIGVSDAVVVMKRNCFIEGKPIGKFPNQFDFIRAKKSELDIFLGMMCPIVMKDDKFELPKGRFEEVNKHLNTYLKMEKKKKIVIVRNNDDLNKKKLKVILGIEGAYFIKSEKDLFLCKRLFNQGIKIIGPLWNFPSSLFSSNKLNTLGKKFLDICNKHNVILDLAHVENTVFWELFNSYPGKIIDSHTCYKKVYDHRRNISNKQAKAIVDRNGLIGLCFIGEFLGDNTLDKVYNHLISLIEDLGEDNICIGSDFDGMSENDLVQGLEDITCYENLFKYLLKRGLSEKTLQKFLFSNASDFFQKAIV